MNIALIVVIFIVVISFIFFGETLPKKYRKRKCTGRAWKKRFPSESNENIREFLNLFVECFAFDDKDKLKFGPDDRLIEIYRELYPGLWQADALEFETLSVELNSRFGLSLGAIWHDELTLGELYSTVKNA